MKQDKGGVLLVKVVEEFVKELGFTLDNVLDVTQDGNTFTVHLDNKTTFTIEVEFPSAHTKH